MKERVLVVGVGPGGRESILPAVRERILLADRLYGARRWLDEWPDCPGQQVALGSNVGELVAQLQARAGERIAILASGDPCFFGIGSTLLEHLPADELEIVPHVSSLQVACARAGLAWDKTIFLSAHARPMREIVGWFRRAPRLGILTDPAQTPGVIARMLLQAGCEDCRAVVAENLGLPGERLVETSLAELPHQQFAALNVLLLVHSRTWRPQPGLASRPDDAYAHRRGLITKADIRVLALARLAIGETDIVWDVGAGSGALSVELSEQAWRGRVFAVEHDAENLGFIQQNIERFGALNVEVVQGRAPAALTGLPAPQAVFMGGSDGEMRGILYQIDAAAPSGCRVVLNVVTLENLHEALSVAGELGWAPQVTQVNLAQGQGIGGLTRLAPMNPVFIVHGTVHGKGI